MGGGGRGVHLGGGEGFIGGRGGEWFTREGRGGRGGSPGEGRGVTGGRREGCFTRGEGGGEGGCFIFCGGGTEWLKAGTARKNRTVMS